MTNKRLQRLQKAYIRRNTADIAELGIWVSKSYIENRRSKQTVTLIGQHHFIPDLWIVEHMDGNKGIYINTELSYNSSDD